MRQIILNRKSRLAKGLTSIACLGMLASGTLARDPGDQAQRAAERTARDADRAGERGARDTERFVQDRDRILRESATDPERATADLKKLEAERQEELAKEAEEAAEEAAEAAADAADDNRGDSDRRSSDEMRSLADGEQPEFDTRGYPVRRGEVSALDLSEQGLAEAKRQGFEPIARENLEALGSIVYRLALPKDVDGQTALSKLRAIEPSATFDYTHFYGQPYAPQGSAAAAAGGIQMARKKGSLTIGMIDTSLVSHNALSGVSISQKNFSGTKGALPTKHGTAVASILVSQGASSLFAANVFQAGAGEPYTSADAILSALNWLAGKQLSVINMSFSGPRNAVLDKLIGKLIGQGTAVVAAAGNGGPSAPPAYPAALSSVVAVTAVDDRMKVYRYANQGRYITVASHGVNEPAAQIDGSIGYVSGTSYATPHIAAWMARCRQSGSAANCNAKLKKTARDLGQLGFDPVYGHGFVG